MVVVVIIITACRKLSRLSAALFLFLGSWVLHFSPLSYFSAAAGAESARLLIFARRVIHYSPAPPARPPWDLQRQQCARWKKKTSSLSPVCSRASQTPLLEFHRDQSREWDGGRVKEFRSRHFYKSAGRPLKSEQVFVYFAYLCVCAAIVFFFKSTTHGPIFIPIPDTMMSKSLVFYSLFSYHMAMATTTMSFSLVIEVLLN